MDEDWIETALAITGGFETAGDPFAGLAGDFDGQGLSCGALQWNVGQGTLQPLVRAAGEACVAAHMPVHGAAFWTAMNASVADGLAAVRAFQNKARLDPGFAAELAAFLVSPEMRRAQIAASRRIGARALRLAQGWARDRGANETTRHEFCWFFDLVTQNGGPKGLALADALAFAASNSEPGYMICDWLAKRAAPEFGWRDARRNAALWREQDAAARDLFVLSYLRAQKCAVRSRAAVMNRKGTIVCGHGWVNGRLRDLSPLLSPPLSPP